MNKEKQIIEEFDKLFTRDDGLIDKYSWYGVDKDDTSPQPTPQAIEMFILEALSSQRKEIIEKIEKYIKKNKGANPLPTIQEEVANEIINLIKNE